MSNPANATITVVYLDDLRDWMLKHAKAERHKGEIAFANHTMSLRSAITRAAKKPQIQIQFVAESEQSATN